MLTITLAHDSWAAGSGELANMADATALLILGAAVASTTQDFGWNNVVRPALLQAWDDGVGARAAAAVAAEAAAAAGTAEEGDTAAELPPMVLHRPKRHLVETRLPNPNPNPNLHPNSHPHRNPKPNLNPKPNPKLHPKPDPNLHRGPDPHQVEIRLPALPAYRILEPETVQLTLPG